MMQPEMFRSSSPMSCTWSRSSKRSWMACASGIETALASEQKSPPGQAMMLVIRPTFGVASPAASSGASGWRVSGEQSRSSSLRSMALVVLRVAGRWLEYVFKAG
ncbi:hypothetical protein D3C72_2229000 [compost metagenome]